MTERADIHRICDEYLRLPWHPGKAYFDSEEEDQPSYQQRREQAMIAAMAEFDRYYAEKQQFMIEVNKLDAEAGRQLRQQFNKHGQDKYPLIKGLDLFSLSWALENLPTATTEKKLRSVIAAGGEWGDSPGPCYIENKKEMETRKREESREQLEEMATQLAYKMGCSVGSMQFITGCHRLLRQHRDRRQGLREDGLCATAYPGTMAGYDQWCEMNDDIQSDISQVYQIIDWLKNHCPLLWCHYQEQRMKRRKKKGSRA